MKIKKGIKVGYLDIFCIFKRYMEFEFLYFFKKFKRIMKDVKRWIKGSFLIIFSMYKWFGKGLGILILIICIYLRIIFIDLMKYDFFNV